MKILYIDPWCADNSNSYYYSTGLAGAIGAHSDLILISQVNCKIPESANYVVKKAFFPYTFHLKQGKLRLFIRGLEYIKAYNEVERLCKSENFDVVHVEWLLLYRYDILILKRIKKKCRLLVLKAHNVLPHSTGEKYVEILRKVYSIPDIILVHGETLKQEFAYWFPEYKEKVRIQRHGLYINHNCSFDEKNICKEVKKAIACYKRVYLFCGRIDYDKGADRLINIWTQAFLASNALLIIAGKVDQGYDFAPARDKCNGCKNILLIEGFIEDSLLNFLISKSSLIVLPYRAGSMSGVAFTAAEFSKPLLSTNFGSISEYLSDGVNSFIVNNNDGDLMAKLYEIDQVYSDNKLQIMGKKLNQYFLENYSWNAIGDKLISEVYLKEIVER